MDAIITWYRAIMMVWLIPAMIDGIALGICTLNSSCVDLHPNAWPASTISLLTWRMPNDVRRTAGGIANTTVARIPGTRPRPKNMAAGIRYTKAGMVCMKSRMGRTMVATVLLRAAQIPSGMPNARLIRVDENVRPRVTTVWSQKWVLSISNNDSRDR